MNIFKKIYYRGYQFVFKLALPFLPYRKPKILKDEKGLVEVLKSADITSVLLVTDRGIRGLGLTNAVESCLAENGIDVHAFEGVVPNPTSQNVEDCVQVYKNGGCGAIIAFGGGSVMDCAKGAGARIAKPKKSLSQMKGVMKVMKKIPLLIAIPTTAGTGSETTLASVITDSQTRHKYAINDFPLIPKYAMLDAKLTLGLPKHITSTTGMDALTHAIEAYIGKSTTPGTRKSALYAVKTIFENLPKVYENGADVMARQNMLLASFHAGLAFTKSYVGYVHAIAHSLGGKYDLPHGLANAIILPYVLRAYGKKIYKKLWKMGIYAGLFDKSTSKEAGAKIFIAKIDDMNRQMEIGNKISCIKEEDIPLLAKTALHEANPLYPVPVLWSEKEITEIYKQIKD